MSHSDAFPYRIYAVDQTNWADSPALAKSVWMRHAKRCKWYAADLEVLSPTSIRLFVYDSCSGGIGKLIFEDVITELTAGEQTVLDGLVLNRYTFMASSELVERETAERAKKILKIRKDLFGV